MENEIVKYLDIIEKNQRKLATVQILVISKKK